MSLVWNATPSIFLSRNLCFSKCLGKSVVVSMMLMLMGNFEISTKLNSICYFSHVLKYKVRKIIKVGIVNEFDTYMYV